METTLDRIHRLSIELLDSVGVRFHCPEIVERLAISGVHVAGDLVRFTEAQVMDCLSMAPEAFTIKARNPEKDVRIGGDSKCLAPAYGASHVVTEDNRRRNATLADDYSAASTALNMDRFGASARKSILDKLGIGDEEGAERLSMAMIHFGAGLLGGKNWSEGLSAGFSKGADAYVSTKKDQQNASLLEAKADMETDRLNMQRQTFNDRRADTALVRMKFGLKAVIVWICIQAHQVIISSTVSKVFIFDF